MEEATTSSTSSTIMAALSTLSPTTVSNLTHSIISATNHRTHRLALLLSSPTLFSLTLHHLHTLSLHQKTLLIARHLLSSLHTLTRHAAMPPPLSTSMRQRDLDAVLLLLLFCETHNHNPELLEDSFSEWRVNLRRAFREKILAAVSFCGGFGLPSIGECNGTILIPYVETVVRCMGLVGSMGCCVGRGNNKEEVEVAAAAAAVVALPAVEVAVGGKECVICKEEMRVGRDVCELPCQHLFHWMCILPWLGKRNTCPCCRLRLPSDDVFGEIQRLWGVLVKIAKEFKKAGY
ncbi:E3 ubiquitin-protein ligase SGR9, amyloplastic [Arachis hypogaea]|nr:E3 ubiquitin-protein ligase SGR9, amyloplastic [Arachis hypogaea]